MGLQVRPTAKSLVVHFQVPEIRNIQLPWDVKMTQQDGEETHRWVRKIQIRPQRISFWLSEEWNSNLICRLVGRLFSLTAVWSSVFLFRLLCWNKKVCRDLNCIFLLTKKIFCPLPLPQQQQQRQQNFLRDLLREAKKINDVSEDKLIEYTDTMVSSWSVVERRSGKWKVSEQTRSSSSSSSN